MKIVIAPFAAKLATRALNPKNYNRWPELVHLVNASGHEVTQIGCEGEPRIAGVAHFLIGWPLDRLKWLINSADLWISVDSFLPHLCATERLKPGIVLWGVSDPARFGYPHNINLLKSTDYLRPLQFQHWKNVPYDPDAFVSPEEVLKAINERILAKAA